MRDKGYSSFFLLFGLLLIVQIIPGHSFAQKAKLKNYLPPDNRSLMLLWGYPNFENENIRQELGKKYGFKLYRFAGCTLPREWDKDAQKHNQQLKNRISKKFGADWKIKYDKEYDRLYALFRRADTVLSHDTSSFWTDRPLAPPTDIDQVYYSEIHRDSVLLVTICSINEWSNNNKLVAFRQFELNIVKKKVTLIATKPKDESLLSANH
ncbi:MAG TPA: hypothetical protein VGO58_16940 [Chitinophagaceae bacterium]|jgi:hypothetical protein|nr:hypothetical protein [Chitinophagaceae bacterium]